MAGDHRGMSFVDKSINTMIPVPISSEILGAMITPAVLISACGVLVLSTSNRVGRTVDRVRSLASGSRALANGSRKFLYAKRENLSEA